MPRTTNPITPAQARLRALAANDARWSRLPSDKRRQQTQAARDAIMAKYLKQVDPDSTLPEDERHKLALQARRADLRSRALKAHRARTAKARARRGLPDDPQLRREAQAVIDHRCPDCGRPPGKGCSRRADGAGRPLAHPHESRMALWDLAS